MASTDNRHNSPPREGNHAFQEENETDTTQPPQTHTSPRDTTQDIPQNPVEAEPPTAKDTPKSAHTEILSDFHQITQHYNHVIEFIDSKFENSQHEFHAHADEMRRELRTIHDSLKELENKLAGLDNTVPRGPGKEAHDHVDSPLPTPVPTESTQTREKASPIPTQLNIEEILAQTKTKAQANLQEDRKRLDMCRHQARFWEERGKALRSQIEKVDSSARELISASHGVLEGMPDGLKNALHNSQQGITIIGRMLKRLLDPGGPLNQLTKEIAVADTLNEIQEDDWNTLLEDQTSDSAILKRINQKLNAIGRDNYRIVSEITGLIEKRIHMCLGFFEKQILPILDGVNDGNKFVSKRFEVLEHDYPDNTAELSQWSKIYSGLRDELTALLQENGVSRMVIETGAQIDFERHEPFCVESDPDMENEQIKEIIREGYEYTAQDGNRCILRPAQVVVVKNARTASDS